MNQAVASKLRKGIAIALKQFPWLREYDKKSGIYMWQRYNEDMEYCWYIGKAKNLLRRTAQHITDGQSHLDKSIKKHGFFKSEENMYGWGVCVLELCPENKLDERERAWIDHTTLDLKLKKMKSKMYNIESGGTVGKTIIGEKKQRRDVKWKAEARAKVISEYREYFDIVPKPNAYKRAVKQDETLKIITSEMKIKPKKLKGEYYGTETN